MPRSIWSGSISFGLVNVPVRMYSAIDEQDLHFHLVHARTTRGSATRRSARRRASPFPTTRSSRPTSSTRASTSTSRTRTSRRPRARVPGRSTSRTSSPTRRSTRSTSSAPTTSGPDDGAEKVYALLVRAMEESGLAAIGTYVMRDKQHLGCLRIRDGVITLEKMYFADEIRPIDEIEADARSRSASESSRWRAQLIDRFTGAFEPEKYEDTYREALLKVIRAKRKGKEIHVRAAGRGGGAARSDGRAPREPRGGAGPRQGAGRATARAPTSPSCRRTSSASARSARASAAARRCRRTS